MKLVVSGNAVWALPPIETYFLKAYDKACKHIGSDYRLANCPFCTAKNHAFAIVPKKQMFYCYACGMGGDLIRFARELHGLSFTDALSEVGASKVRDTAPIREGAKG